jgi:hypothetical protein
MLKKHIFRLLWLLILLVVFTDINKVNSQNDSLSISVLTVSKGIEVHSLFGHTALRVRNINDKTDLVYNFGLFDFETPFFFYRFLSGKLPYYIGSHTYFDFLKIYAAEKRKIDEQYLNLNLSEKNRIADSLDWFIKPENRYYKYEFFDKNCTSIIRDILLKKTGLYDSLTQIMDTITYRDMLNHYLKDRLWYKLGINLITGAYTDKSINRVEAMALPDMFMSGLNDIQLRGKPIVYKHNTITKQEVKVTKLGKVFSPFILFTVLLLSFLLFKAKWIKYTVVLLSVCVGSFLIFLWSITEHIDLQNNWDILIVNPLYIILIFEKIKLNIIKQVSLILLILLLIRAFISLIGAQELPIDYLPIIVLNAFILVNAAKGSKLKIHQA